MGHPFATALVVLALASMIGQAPPAGPGPVRFRHVNVVDVRAGTVRPDQDVTIRDGRIASVRPATDRDEAGVRSIDASGKFLIPGLADMHVHDIANTRRIAAVAARGRLLERAEIDGILEHAAKLSSLKSMSEAMLAAIARDEVDAAVRSYRELKARQAAVYDFSESELNEAGYALMRQKKFADAIALLELNVEMYPRSGNVYDSLGEAHAAAGHRELAIANYRKSLAIEPGNQNAIDQLKKLGGG